MTQIRVRLQSVNKKPLPFPKSLVKTVYNFIGFPFRTILLTEPLAEKAGFTSLQQERINAVWPHLHERVLDIGAGNNRLINLYGNGVGVDVYDWKGGAQILANTATLPFADDEFDTITLVACLNHIPTRQITLKEAYRVLRPGGRCLVTMINPIIGSLAHTLLWHEESHERGMEKDELNGLWNRQTIELMSGAGFQLTQIEPFFYGLNNLFVAVKPENQKSSLGRPIDMTPDIAGYA